MDENIDRENFFEERFETTPSWHPWRYDSRFLQIELTWLRWGIGFDIGIDYYTGFGLWIGPLFICVTLDQDD